MVRTPASDPDPLYAPLGDLGPVCRLGLATRGDAQLEPEAYLRALDSGVNYFNWCGYRDGMSAAIQRLGPRRREVLLAAQFEARTADAARTELARLLNELRTDWIDVLTYYYVESAAEWQEITGPGGAAEYLAQARSAGQVRCLGLTSHQRELAATIAAAGEIDLLMIRYNAAHRGAERQVFPVTRPRGMPVVAYTALRWQALLRSTPEDPPDFVPPTATECYRFVLAHPAVSVVLMAPGNEAELTDDLKILARPSGLTPERYAELVRHGERVRRHAGSFP
ncbi:MAG: aldo/keto reductase [Planctomycetaceae bacterium]|nr:aldo/keto reductase [Planctomycetaceae bacterium]